MIGPTRRQRDVLNYIERYQAERGGVSPTMAEIAAHLGTSLSRGRVAELLKGLEARGLIRRLKYRARAIEIIRPVKPVPMKVFRFDDEAKALVRVQ